MGALFTKTEYVPVTQEVEVYKTIHHHHTEYRDRYIREDPFTVRVKEKCSLFLVHEAGLNIKTDLDSDGEVTTCTTNMSKKEISWHFFKIWDKHRDDLKVVYVANREILMYDATKFYHSNLCTTRAVAGA